MANDITVEEKKIDIKEDINISIYQKTDEEYMEDLNKVNFVPWVRRQIDESSDGKIRFKLKDLKKQMGEDYKLISDDDFFSHIKRIFDDIWADEKFIINMSEHLEGDKILVIRLDYSPIKIISTGDESQYSQYTFENPNPDWRKFAIKWIDVSSNVFENWIKIESSSISPKFEKYPVACIPNISLNTDFMYQQAYREYAWRAESSLLQKIYIQKIVPARCERNIENGANIYMDNSGGFQITGSIEGTIEVDSVYSGVTLRKLLTDEFSLSFWNKPSEFRKKSMNMIYNLLMIADKIYELPNNI